MGVFDVDASKLIEAVAKDLQEKFKLEKPAFADYVKTGPHKERAPDRDDWYYVRVASILYRVYKEGPLGTGALRSYYGGRKNRGVEPEKKVKAGGKIIRKALQDLEKLGLIEKGKTGRVISPKGQSYLDKKAKELELTEKASVKAQ
jgi:small subunit ribosomal protein S19e